MLIKPFEFWYCKGDFVYYSTHVDAGIVARDGVAGLYRGFVPNALKTLPNSRYVFSPIVYENKIMVCIDCATF